MPQDVNRASMPLFLPQIWNFHPWAAIGTQPRDGIASMAKYHPALDAREIKHFLDARAKGITIKLRGAAAFCGVPLKRIVMPECIKNHHTTNSHQYRTLR